jgi:hypothetical protein
MSVVRVSRRLRAMEGRGAERARAAFLCAAMFAAALPCACGPTVVRNDRTEGVSLELHWNSAAKDQIGYYVVETSGEFRSSGGAMAADRTTTFRTPLTDADIAAFRVRIDALDARQRPTKSGDAGDRTEVVVRDAFGRHEFIVRGADPAVDALRAWCGAIALRQYRDTIEAQHDAGPRRR